MGAEVFPHAEPIFRMGKPIFRQCPDLSCCTQVVGIAVGEDFPVDGKVLSFGSLFDVSEPTS